jgi:hypothetical protein
MLLGQLVETRGGDNLVTCLLSQLVKPTPDITRIVASMQRTVHLHGRVGVGLGLGWGQG